MPSTEQTIILAAGLGSRLGTAEAGIPKPLLHVAGVPLIAHALAHAAASGCREAVVVVGYQGQQVRDAVVALGTRLALRFVETPDATAPNGHSLLAAAPVARERFFLQMVDHVFSRPVLPLLDRTAWREHEGGRLLVDPRPSDDLDLDDATKVRRHGELIIGIGKGLDPWDAVDTGCFGLTPVVFDALRVVAATTESLTVSSAMRRLAHDRMLFATSIESATWADVDTPADRAVAERLLAAHSQRQVDQPSEAAAGGARVP